MRKPSCTRLLVLLSLLMAGVPVAAAPGRWWLDVNLTSWHSRGQYFHEGRFQEYNARNFGLGLSYDASEWCDVKAGWFNNSYHRTSLYVLVHPRYDFVRSPKGMFAVGAGGGLITGYDGTVDDLARVSPMGILAFTISDERRWRVTLGYLPFRLLLGDNHADVLTLQAGWRL